jgi:folate-binding protein YgfZ
MRSPLLDLPGAVARVRQPGATDATDPDVAIAWHYGDPIAEQRAAVNRSALFDLSHRDVLAVTGEDRLRWLHTLTTQSLESLPDGGVTEALLLSPTGHVEHHMVVTAVGETVYLDTEPGQGAALSDFLDSMRFWSKVEVAPIDLRLLRIAGPRAVVDGAPATGATARGAGFARLHAGAIEVAVPAAEIGSAAAEIIAAGSIPAGSWAADALRIESLTPRFGVDTDEKTIPNETSWLGSAVHLNKGCYRGQETVARVNNLGRPPRRMVMLNLDGSVNRLPGNGSEVTAGAIGQDPATGRRIGRVGSVSYHHENGPIALALIKRSVPVETPLLADGVDASIDPDSYPDDEPGAQRSTIDRKALSGIRRR